MRPREYFIVLRNLQKAHGLDPWRRAIAEHLTLQYYHQFVEGLRSCGGRKGGDSARNLAHKKYVEHMFPDATPEERETHKGNMKRDLQFARRWAILTGGYVNEDGIDIPGAGVGYYLAASLGVIGKMYCARRTCLRCPDTDLHPSNSTASINHAYLKKLHDEIVGDRVTMMMCRVLEPVAESLIWHHRLVPELDWRTISASLTYVIRGEVGQNPTGVFDWDLHPRAHSSARSHGIEQWIGVGDLTWCV